MIRRALIALAIGLLPIAAASAQTSQGPMVIEEVPSGGFLAAPDFKVTEVNHQTSGLAGGYAGVVFAEHFFIGGGAYFDAWNEHHGTDFAYGGLILQLFGGGNTFGYGAKVLLGGGDADVNSSIQTVDRGRTVIVPYHSHQGFWVTEPEIDARIRIARGIHLTAGVGYRFTGSGYYGYYGYYGTNTEWLNGATGSIGLQIGGGGR